jgi:hypothetical protein
MTACVECAYYEFPIAKGVLGACLASAQVAGFCNWSEL